MARGAMRPKSRLASLLQPMSYISVVMYRKEGRDLHNLASAETVRRFPYIIEELERIAAGMSVVEIINAALHDEDRNDPLFDALVESIEGLNNPSNDERTVLLWFMVRLASSLGFPIRTDECGICEETFIESEGEIPWSLQVGAPLCLEHRDGLAWRGLDPLAFRFLRRLRNESIDVVATARPGSQIIGSLHDTLQGFIRLHVEGMRRLHAGGIASQLLAGGTRE